MFMVVPITMVAAFSSNNALYTGAAPAQGNVNLFSLKTNFMNLLHQADLQINAKTIESTQPFINIQKHYQMLSEMSVSDLANVGPTIEARVKSVNAWTRSPITEIMELSPE